MFNRNPAVLQPTQIGSRPILLRNGTKRHPNPYGR